MYLYKIIKYSESFVGVVSVQLFDRVDVGIPLNRPILFLDILRHVD